MRDLRRTPASGEKNNKHTGYYYILEAHPRKRGKELFLGFFCDVAIGAPPQAGKRNGDITKTGGISRRTPASGEKKMKQKAREVQA